MGMMDRQVKYEVRYEGPGHSEKAVVEGYGVAHRCKRWICSKIRQHLAPLHTPEDWHEIELVGFPAMMKALRAMGGEASYGPLAKSN